MRVGFFILFLISTIFAHRLNLFITQNSDELEIFSYYGKNINCIDCDILILDEKSNLLTKAKTDKNGKLFFTTKQNKIIVISQDESGHKAQIEFTKDSVQNSKNIQNEISFYKILLALFGIFIVVKLFATFRKKV